MKSMILLIEKVFDKHKKNIHEEENVIKLFEQKVILAFLLVLNLGGFSRVDDRKARPISKL